MKKFLYLKIELYEGVDFMEKLIYILVIILCTAIGVFWGIRNKKKNR